MPTQVTVLNPNIMSWGTFADDADGYLWFIGDAANNTTLTRVTKSTQAQIHNTTTGAGGTIGGSIRFFPFQWGQQPSGPTAYFYAKDTSGSQTPKVVGINKTTLIATGEVWTLASTGNAINDNYLCMKHSNGRVYWIAPDFISPINVYAIDITANDGTLRFAYYNAGHTGNWVTQNVMQAGDLVWVIASDSSNANAITAISFDPSQVAVGGELTAVNRFSVGNFGQQVNYAAYDPTGSGAIIFGDGSGTVRRWDIGTHTITATHASLFNFDFLDNVGMMWSRGLVNGKLVLPDFTNETTQLNFIDPLTLNISSNISLSPYIALIPFAHDLTNGWGTLYVQPDNSIYANIEDTINSNGSSPLMLFSTTTGTLVVNPTSLSFSATQGGSNPASQNLNLTSTGTSASWVTIEDQTFPNAGSWPSANWTLHSTNNGAWSSANDVHFPIPNGLPDATYNSQSPNGNMFMEMRFPAFHFTVAGFEDGFTLELHRQNAPTSPTNIENIRVLIHLSNGAWFLRGDLNGGASTLIASGTNAIVAGDLFRIEEYDLGTGNLQVNFYQNGTVIGSGTFATVIPDGPNVRGTFEYFGQSGTANGSTVDIGDVKIGNRTAASILNFTASSDSAWLGVAPTSGTIPNTLGVSATVGVLTHGTYTGHVTVTSVGASGSPAIIPITFNIAAPANTSTTSLVSSEAPSQYEDEVTFTATVTGTSPAPTGTVGFFDGVTLLGTVGLTGATSSTSTAAFTTNALTPGVHSLTAVYSGDSNYSGSTSPVFLQQVTAVVILPSILPSFALTATFSSQGDVNLPPSASLTTVPQTTTAGQSITLLWSTTNVNAVQITGTNGVDPAFDTGIRATNGSGAYVWGNGFTHTMVLTMTCFDRLGHVLPISASATVTIT